jgi:hypothetical protein
MSLRWAGLLLRSVAVGEIKVGCCLPGFSLQQRPTLSSILTRHCRSRRLRCSIGGSESANEIPPLGTLRHLSNEETNGLVRSTGRTPSWFGIIGVTRLHAWFTFSTSSGVPREDPTVETLCTNPFAFGCSESLVSSCNQTRIKNGNVNETRDISESSRESYLFSLTSSF